MRADPGRLVRRGLQPLLRPERRFWLLVGLIALVGAWLRLLVHDFGLPWFEEIDELRIWFYGRSARGIPSDVAPAFDGTYAPLIVWLHQLTQPWTEAQGRPFAADAVLDLRRLLLLLNVLGTLWIAMLARRCGGAAAGLLAAAFWAFTRFMLGVTVFAISESLAVPLLILTLMLATRSLEPGRPWWPALLSLGTGLLCFLAEFRLMAAFFPGLAVLLWRAWHHYRPGWRWVALWTLLFTVPAALAGVAIFSRLSSYFQRIALAALRTHLWDLQWLELHFDEVLQLLNLGLLLIIFLPAAATLPTRPAGADARRRRPALLLTFATLLLSVWATSALRPYIGRDPADLVWPRHLLPAITLAYVLLAAALTRVGSALSGHRARSLLTASVVAYLMLFQLLPSLGFAQERRVLPWPVIVRHWVDDNLEPGTILITPGPEHERWFDPFWGAIPHRKWFDWLVADIRDRPLQEWVETHQVTWLAMPFWQQQHLQQSPEGHALLNQLLPLRAFVAPPARRETEMVFYRLWRMQRETDIRFGETLRLLGYDLHHDAPAPGGEQAFTFYWNAPEPPPQNYSLFLHLVPARGVTPLAQTDGNPAMPQRLTQTWTRPEETLISPRFTLSLPADLPPGDYRVLLGLYDYETGARLPVQDELGRSFGDAWEVTRLRIPPPSPP